MKRAVLNWFYVDSELRVVRPHKAPERASVAVELPEQSVPLNTSLLKMKSLKKIDEKINDIIQILKQDVNLNTIKFIDELTEKGL